MDVEAAELLLLRFSGDGERARDELVEQTSHHFSDPSMNDAGLVFGEDFGSRNVGKRKEASEP